MQFRASLYVQRGRQSCMEEAEQWRTLLGSLLKGVPQASFGGVRGVRRTHLCSEEGRRLFVAELDSKLRQPGHRDRSGSSPAPRPGRSLRPGSRR